MHSEGEAVKLEYLEEFCALAVTLNYAKVAKQFHVSTSVLSKHISSLEKEVGHQLFMRSTTSVELTPDGRRLYEGIYPVVEQYRSFMDEYCSTPASRTRELNVRLHVRSKLVVGSAVRAANALEKKNDVRVNYAPATSSPYADLAPSSTADAVITYATGKVPAESVKVPLLDDPFVAVLPKSHPLASRASLSIVRDLPSNRIIRLKGSYFEPGQDTITDMLERYHVKAPAVYSLASTFDDIAMFSNFEDILILPSGTTSVLQMVTPETHVILPFEEEACFHLALIYMPAKHSSTLQLLIDEIKRQIGEGS